MKILSAVSTASPTLTSRGLREARLAAMDGDAAGRPHPALEAVADSGDDGVLARLDPRHVGAHRPVHRDAELPARPTIQAARALATSVLVGMQPVLTQVPPNHLRSTIAVRIPAAASCAASGGPARPPR
ncbi:MAG: hypothetical protein U1E53_25825 [Dongiaceae bacterium]